LKDGMTDKAPNQTANHAPDPAMLAKA